MGEVGLTVASVAAALLGGGLAGYGAGARIRGRTRAFFGLNVAAVIGCAALDLAALSFGQRLLGYSAIGLMGGLMTGIKYGYTDSLRLWPEPDPAETPADGLLGQQAGQKADDDEGTGSAR